MGNLTKNISRHELACSCGCGLDSMDWETINVVQECCDYAASVLHVDKVVLYITSASRCYKYNRVPVEDGGPGSSDASQHPKCRAIDFEIAGVGPAHIYTYLDQKYPGKYGIGRYKTFTHLDTRTNGPARW